MKLVVVSSSEKFRSEIPMVIDLLNAGLETFHLRKSKFTTARLAEYIEQIPEKYHSRIIIHSHHKLALRYNLKGIHLSKTHRKKSAKTFLKLLWYKLRKPKLVITRSFHQIETMQSSRVKFNYAFLNPFFSKIDSSKNSFDVNKDFLAKSISNSRVPIYASGNITTQNYHLLKGMHLTGMALSKMIWKSNGNHVATFLEIKKEIATW